MTGKKEKLKVVLLGPYKEKHRRPILEVTPQVEVVICADPDEALPEMEETEILVCQGHHFRPDLYRASSRLKWIHALTAGVENILTPEVKDSPVIVTHSAGIHAVPIAEHIMTFILSFVRRFNVYFRQQVQSRWNQIRLDELAGKTVGILGMGYVGRALAKRAKAFEMKVVALRRHPEKPDDVDEVFPPEGLNQVLEAADFVVVCLPLTPETRGLLGEKEFRAMKKSAYLVNIARGQIVDEKALVRALQEGWIAGAGLDVFAEEPLPPESPLWRLENVIITPHQAGGTPYFNQRGINLFAENLKRFLQGEKLVNLVDKDLGY